MAVDFQAPEVTFTMTDISMLIYSRPVVKRSQGPAGGSATHKSGYFWLGLVRLQSKDSQSTPVRLQEDQCP